MISDDRTADQSHEYLGCNDFFGQGSSIYAMNALGDQLSGIGEHHVVNPHSHKKGQRVSLIQQ